MYVASGYGKTGFFFPFTKIFIVCDTEVECSGKKNLVMSGQSGTLKVRQVSSPQSLVDLRFDIIRSWSWSRLEDFNQLLYTQPALYATKLLLFWGFFPLGFWILFLPQCLELLPCPAALPRGSGGSHLHRVLLTECVQEISYIHLDSKQLLGSWAIGLIKIFPSNKPKPQPWIQAVLTTAPLREFWGLDNDLEVRIKCVYVERDVPWVCVCIRAWYSLRHAPQTVGLYRAHVFMPQRASLAL